MMMDTTVQPVPQTEMDALLLGRTKVCKFLKIENHLITVN